MGEENWRESLSDELKGNESLSAFEGIEDLAKSYIETKAMVGSGIRVPGDDASDEQKGEFLATILEKAPTLMRRPNFEDTEQSTEFFRTLGMPEEAKGYEISKYEEMSFDEGREELLRGLAHGAGITAKQYKALTEGMLKFDHEMVQAGEGTASEEMATLRQDWGMTWKERKVLANRVRETFFPFIPEAQMDAKTIKALHAVGAQLGSGEGSEFGDHRNDDVGDGKMTPSDALARIDEIMNNNEHAYWVNSHPGHGAAIKEMIELRKMADPAAGTTMPRAGFGS